MPYKSHFGWYMSRYKFKYLETTLRQLYKSAFYSRKNQKTWLQNNLVNSPFRAIVYTKL